MVSEPINIPFAFKLYLLVGVELFSSLMDFVHLPKLFLGIYESLVDFSSVIFLIFNGMRTDL